MTFSTFHVRYFYNISTHILTRRMTKIGLIQLEKLIFQLTSSQGGWPSLQAQKIGEMYFNSHPHKEDDRSWYYIYNTGGIFQLTSSQGGWPALRAAMGLPENISTHILTRRMTAILNKNTLFKITFYINNRHFISIVDIFFHFHIYF